MPEGDLTVANSTTGDLTPLLEKIIEDFPAPKGDPVAPLQIQINALDYDNHLGRYLIGRIFRGTARIGDSVVILHSKGSQEIKETGKIKKILVREGLEFIEVNSAIAGEIVAIIGIESMAIGGTICTVQNPEPLPDIKISPPAVKIKFEANTSPYVGKEGKFVTATQLAQRLELEKANNISLKINPADGGGYFVAGRGELQLSILIETLRREGYEFQVRKPEIILQMIDGVKSEPKEELIIDTREEYIGTIIDFLNRHKGELVHIETENGLTRITYKILTRNLFGLRSHLQAATKGNVVLNHYISEYVPYTNQPELYRKGVLIASEAGTAMGYSLNTVQERGDLFTSAGTQVYEGMIVGMNKYDQDMEVNVTKQRQKSGVRVKHDEITQTTLKPIIPITLEFALVFIAKDEILEITPNNLRLRKAYLSKNERVWSKRKNLSEFAKVQISA